MQVFIGYTCGGSFLAGEKRYVVAAADFGYTWDEAQDVAATMRLAPAVYSDVRVIVAVGRRVDMVKRLHVAYIPGDEDQADTVLRESSDVYDVHHVADEDQQWAHIYSGVMPTEWRSATADRTDHQGPRVVIPASFLAKH